MLVVANSSVHCLNNFVFRVLFSSQLLQATNTKLKKLPSLCTVYHGVSRRSNVYMDLNVWKDGCIEILMVKMRNDVVPMLMVYAGVGVILAIVELITVVLACAYVAQISRRDKKNSHMRDRTANAGGMYEEEYLQTLNAKETNF